MGFLTQKYKTGRSRGIEDKVIPPQMTFNRETGNSICRETPGGTHRARNLSETTAEFTPTRKTVLALRWRANWKAKQQI